MAPAVLAGIRAALGPGARVAVWDADGPRVEGGAPGERAAVDGDPGACARVEVDAGGLVAGRDAVGHRSLFWAEPEPGVVIVASTLEGVLGSGLVPRRLRVGGVAAFLTYAYVPGTDTLVEGVRALDGGTALVADTTGTRVRREWALPEAPDGDATEDALRRALRATLEEVVGEALPAGPVGATLSGGIDSSLVLALARRATGAPMRCWSVSFGPPHADELAWSGLVSAHLGVPQEVVTVLPDQVRARFDDTVGALSEPNGDPLTVPNLLLFEAAAGFTGVLLNGEGGDPTFGGPKNAPMLLAELFDPDEPPAVAYLRAHQRLFDELARYLDPALDPSGAAARLAADLAPELEAREGRLDRLMAVNVRYKGAWHILPKVDHLAAPAGVWPRSPLFDRRVVELAFRIPGPLKRRGSVEKHLLKEAARDLLPAAIVDRPKSGMMVPVEAWFDGPLRAWATERLLDGLAPLGLVRRDALEALLERRGGGLRPRRGIKIWLLLTLEAWLRTHRVTT